MTLARSGKDWCLAGWSGVGYEAGLVCRTGLRRSPHLDCQTRKQNVVRLLRSHVERCSLHLCRLGLADESSASHLNHGFREFSPPSASFRLSTFVGLTADRIERHEAYVVV
jgi:hypothetical protein